MAVSFAPKDFGTGRWQGGPAHTSNPRFEYDTADYGKGPERVINFLIDYTDSEGAVHPGRFRVGNAQYAVIRVSGDDGADEAETGTGLSHVDPSKSYRVSGSSEFGIFIANAVAGGMSEAKLESGDVAVFDDLDVEVTPKPKKEGDRFPLLCITRVALGKGDKAGKSAAKTGAKAPTGKTSDAITTEASRIVSLVISESSGPVMVSDVIRRAVKELKGNPLKGDVVRILGEESFLSAGSWVYDDEDKTVA